MQRTKSPPMIDRHAGMQSRNMTNLGYPSTDSDVSEEDQAPPSLFGHDPREPSPAPFKNLVDPRARFYPLFADANSKTAEITCQVAMIR
jgi:hypothetical protein